MDSYEKGAVAEADGLAGVNRRLAEQNAELRRTVRLLAERSGLQLANIVGSTLQFVDGQLASFLRGPHIKLHLSYLLETSQCQVLVHALFLFRFFLSKHNSLLLIIVW